MEFSAKKEPKFCHAHNEKHNTHQTPEPHGVPLWIHGNYGIYMSQRHPLQTGPFLVTTNAQDRIPWLIEPGVREVLIDNLCMTRNLYQAHVYGFCILPDHMHIVLNPGEKGISKFMHSFKRQSIADLHVIFPQPYSGGARTSAVGGNETRMMKWQKGFDARILNTAHYLSDALTYVAHNGVHHGFVEHAEDWPGTSLQYSDLLDDPS